MKIDTMRSIDYWVGIPLAFILSNLLKIKRIFLKNKAKKPKNILLIELSEMGSTILADPLMQHLKKKYQGTLYFAIFSQNAISLELLNTVEKKNIFVFREHSLLTLIIDFFKYIFWCRKKKIDTVFDLELFSRVTALLTGVSGAGNTIGFHSFYQEGLYRGDMLTHKVSYNSHIHISKNFMALANSLDCEVDDKPYSKTIIADVKLQKVVITEEQKETVRLEIKKRFNDFNNQRIVLINPNASDLLPQRRWAKESFQIVIESLLAKYEDIVVLITGSPNEFDEAEILTKKIANNRCVNFAGGVSFLELPTLYDLSSVMLTNDSGPGHFSSITNMPTIVLFGPETPNLYGSLGVGEAIYKGLACSPCVSAHNHRKTPCNDNVCLQKITTDEVLIALDKYL
ncbi:ADP-heptose--lipooligosaccharide heptosyltransferase II [hydrothermal vent metagenome]|uniref:ADP-heptose--lipooligosaccharide heptosyltransferase II n=1 Tax=hydrothermal vent metagenome TaxID=652676 RepID=A0A1W1CCJ7_9ZZZZ